MMDLLVGRDLVVQEVKDLFRILVRVVVVENDEGFGDLRFQNSFSTPLLTALFFWLTSSSWLL
jgi:hypothetical protein